MSLKLNDDAQFVGNCGEQPKSALRPRVWMLIVAAVVGSYFFGFIWRIVMWLVGDPSAFSQ